jgi:hypothetical protein
VTTPSATSNVRPGTTTDSARTIARTVPGPTHLGSDRISTPRRE